MATAVLAAMWFTPVEAGAPGAPATLHRQVVVEGEVIRLGDLFDYSGPGSEEVVAYAPLPGRRAVFDANWLANVARRHRLDWRPTSRLDRVTVERLSAIVTYAEVEAALLEELELSGYGAGYQLRLRQRNLRIHIPADQPATVEIRSLTVEPRSGRLSAIVASPAGHPRARQVQLTGRLIPVIAVPVPVRSLGPGEIIAEPDLEWAKVPEARIRGNVVTDISLIIGTETRRPLRAGEPLRMNDFRKPVAVAKGKSVTMVFTSPGIVLTATGRALDDGSLGDAIRVQNSQTGVVVEATVFAPGQVRVTPTARLALN
ncbi:MAG: flagellar basal body P-ring formation chaperone FlgA [Alphaproteobacteria bacterium]